MKNQYFGDINDYRKYGLLRLLAANGKLRVGICWMLTAPDSRTDGKFIDYVDKEKYRAYDSELFDALKMCLYNVMGRCVSFADECSIIPDAVYYSELLSDDEHERMIYFGEFAEKSQNCDLVFFDPDNGIEIKSTLKGRKDSCKYLYWDELQNTYDSGKSVLFYQHFRHEKREATIASLSGKIRERLGAPKVIAFRTAHVLFLLIPQLNHQEQLEQQANEVVKQWHPEITLG